MYLIQEIPRYYTAFAEWVACTLYIIALRRKVNNKQLVIISAVFFLWQQVLMVTTKTAPLFLWIPIMAAAVFSLYLYVYFTCELTKKDIGFCVARIFVLAEFCAALQWQIYTFIIQKSGIDHILFQHISCLVLYGMIFSIDYFIEIRKLPHERGLEVRMSELVNTFIIALTIFLFSNLSFLNVNTPFSASNMPEIFYIRTLVDLCGVLMLYSQQDDRQKRYLSHEMQSINDVLVRQYNQYKMSHDNIEVLNQKYHDLKHQIIAIRQENNIEKKEQYLLDMENRIKMYQSVFQTGNQVLDVMLTTKAEYCSHNQIDFNCVADGKAVEFMDTMDICSIFGNALDNAIESVQKQEDPQKRLIRVAVYTKDQLTMIRFENYTQENLEVKNGLLNTTKKNKDYHGYGLKSIHSIVDKYGGTMTLNVEQNWFILRILIPNRKNKRK